MLLPHFRRSGASYNVSLDVFNEVSHKTLLTPFTFLKNSHSATYIVERARYSSSCQIMCLTGLISVSIASLVCLDQIFFPGVHFSHFIVQINSRILLSKIIGANAPFILNVITSYVFEILNLQLRNITFVKCLLIFLVAFIYFLFWGSRLIYKKMLQSNHCS